MRDARDEYADIIDLERPVSEKHPPMPRANRAAQFSPFAALTGYDDLIREAERETDERAELDENSVEALDRKLIFLLSWDDAPEAVFTYFIPDSKKAGGAYRSVAGRILRYDRFARSLTLTGGETVLIDDIRGIESDVFGDALW